jgi:rhodanese-related sulfurtransferase
VKIMVVLQKLGRWVAESPLHFYVIPWIYGERYGGSCPQSRCSKTSPVPARRRPPPPPHPQTLEQAGLVTTRREGACIHDRLAGTDAAELYVLLQQVARDRLAEAGRAHAAYPGPAGADHPTREGLLERVANGTVTVIDVRPAQECAAGHVPGAFSTALDELEYRLAEPPYDTEVVAYCRGAGCAPAHDAVRLLTARGLCFLRLADGPLEWRLGDLPVETGAM